MSSHATRFVKYHGLGNDFILFDGGLAGARPFDAEEVRRLCHRGLGIGGDGVMLVRPSERAAFRMELSNSDGSIPEMCGNGLRCFVKHAVEEHDARDNPLAVETNGGVKLCHWRCDDEGRVTSVRVDMGAPAFERARVPMTGQGSARDVELTCLGRRFVATGVNTGNPHMVIFGEASQELARRYGPRLTVHPWWPLGANVEFAAERGPREFDVVVWERGCGLTQACGTGATAVVAAAAEAGRVQLDVPITVHLPGGDLQITIEADFRTAWMEGPAVEVYRGTLSAAGTRAACG